MRVDLFDFELPEANIALRPLADREAAKLLYVAANGALSDNKVADIPGLLRPDDILVFNNTKVLPANLKAVRSRASVFANINVNLHKRLDIDKWMAFVKPAKRVAVGETLYFLKADTNLARASLCATILEKYDNGEVLLHFNLQNEALNAAINYLGHMPIPPYIASRRKQDIQDVKDYQTIFAQEEGAVAAPTAGLHFTENIFKQLQAKNIEYHFLTLHVGAGTFLPVKVEDTDAHIMHSEMGYLPISLAQTLNVAKSQQRRIIAVGTTSLRLLESASIDHNKLASFSGETNIFITPGYKFKFVDALITNFHLPRSTLFMLVSAFCGLNTMNKAYAHAITHNYRFYSYGDTSFLELNQYNKIA